MTERKKTAIANETTRFWSKVAIGRPEDCWPWKGPLDKQGRGVFSLAGGLKQVLAHRFAFEQMRGPIAEGERCHQDCNNPRCCNCRHFSVSCPFARLSVYNAAPGTFLADVKDFLGWLASMNFADLTIETYGLELEYFDRWLGSTYPDVHSIAGVTREQIRAFTLYLYQVSTADGGRLSHPTRSKKLNIIKSFLKYCRRETDLDVVDWQRITVPRNSRGVDRIPRTVASADQVAQLIAACSTDTVVGRRNRAILALLFAAGLRISELCDLDRSALPIERLGQEPIMRLPITGKGGHARLCFVDRESQFAIRTMMEDRIGDQDAAAFIHYRPGTRIDAKHRGSHRISARAIQQTMAELSKKAGLPAGLTPHTLRHGFAVDLLKGGVDLRQVQSLMGHSNIQTTMTYTRLEDSYLAEGYARRRSLRGDQVDDVGD